MNWEQKSPWWMVSDSGSYSISKAISKGKAIYTLWQTTPQKRIANYETVEVAKSAAISIAASRE